MEKGQEEASISISDADKNLQLEKIWKELVLANPHQLPNLVQKQARFNQNCVLSIVSCLISSNLNDMQLNEKSASYLPCTFDERNITSFWHRIDDNTQVSLLYGLFLLSQSSCGRIKDESLSVLRALMTYDMTYKQSHSFYSPPIFVFIKYMNEAKNGFRAIIENWQSVVVVGEVGWEGMVNGGNLIVSLIKGGDDNIRDESWNVLAFLVMHIQSTFMPLLDDILAQVLVEGEIDAYGSGTEYNLLFQSVYADLLNHNSVPSKADIGGQQMINSLFIKLHPFVRDVFCALSIRLLLEKPESRDKANLIIASIERSSPGRRTWVEGAPLMDRLLLLLKESEDPCYVIAILQCLYHLSEADTPLMIRPLEELVDVLTSYFTSHLNREVQFLAGKCLEKFLNFEFYPRSRPDYWKIQKSLRNNNFSRFDTELQELLRHYEGILESNLDKLGNLYGQLGNPY